MRVSNLELDAGMQHNALTVSVADRVLTDQASGALTVLPQVTVVLDQLRPGDGHLDRFIR